MSSNPQPFPESEIQLRAAQLKDLDAVESLLVEAFTEEYGQRSVDFAYQVRRLRKWYGPLKLLSLFPNRFQHLFTVHVAEQEDQILGMIQVSPFNHYRSTWRVDHLAVSPKAQRQGIGSKLLRHCMAQFREARMWVLEVNIHNSGAIAVYTKNGFQRLAELTYWSLAADTLAQLAEQDPKLPNLYPVSNRDAQLLYYLETDQMPPLVRQVYDLDQRDFWTSPFDWAIDRTRQTISDTERVQCYVYEPERNKAIGYFNLKLSRTGQQPHVARLTVHPAYTELYPGLMAQMARLTQTYPPQSLSIASTDYQPEREEFLLKVGAEDMERTLLMSRSVWHKLRETRVSLENLRLQAVLRGLQVNQPIPERIDLASAATDLIETSQLDLWSSEDRSPGEGRRSNGRDRQRPEEERSF